MRALDQAKKPTSAALVPARPLSAGVMQAKLAIGAPGDAYEQEADRAAEQVMRMSEPELRAAGGDEAGKPSPGPARLQAKPVGAGGQGQAIAPTSVHEALRSPGQPLNPEVRAFMEPRFKHDFSRVRVHADATGAQSAQDVAAQAYTVGHDIVFGAGQFAPGTARGRRLIAHELAHVAQQQGARAVLQRQPTPDPPTKLQPFVPAEQILDLRKGPGPEWKEEWIVVLNGHISPESAGRALWPRWVPLSIEISLDMALTEPIERGIFKITGINEHTVKLMEPSIAKLFTARLAEEARENRKMEEARKKFRDKHDDLGEWILSTIDFSLKKATKGNPDLRLAFYNYYAHAGFDDMNSDDFTGTTDGGDTKINRKVLLLESGFKTDDPTALLGGTLIHEFVHTPQGVGSHVVADAPKEAKAYGVESFFAERMGDRKREAVIDKRYSGNDPIDLRTGGKQIFNDAYYIMTKLYEDIDYGDSATAAKARAMSVEFISKNAEDYGPDLRAFIAKHMR